MGRGWKSGPSIPDWPHTSQVGGYQPNLCVCDWHGPTSRQHHLRGSPSLLPRNQGMEDKDMGLSSTLHDSQVPHGLCDQGAPVTSPILPDVIEDKLPLLAS